MHRLLTVTTVFFLALALTATPAEAQDLVYQPQNPAFGGNPGNFSWMMQSAEVQYREDEDAEDAFARDPLDNFEQNLQRQLLNAISREFVREQFGEVDMEQGGTFDFGDFTIDITPGLEGVTLDVFNMVTGDETTVTIPHF